MHLLLLQAQLLDRVVGEIPVPEEERVQEELCHLLAFSVNNARHEYSKPLQQLITLKTLLTRVLVVVVAVMAVGHVSFSYCGQWR